MKIAGRIRRTLVKAPPYKLVVAPPQRRRFPERRQRQGAQGETAFPVGKPVLFPQLHHAHRFLVPYLGKGVFQGRSAVADALAADILGTVNVSQCHIVKGCEHRRVHVIRAAHRQLLRFAPERAGDELVGHKQVPHARIGLHGADHGAERVGIGFDCLIGEKAADVCGLDKGKEIEIHPTELVAQGKGRDRAGVDRGKMDAAPVHQPSAEGEPFGRIVVPADEKHLRSAQRKAVKKIVEQLHRLGGGNRLIVNIPGDQDAVRGFLVRKTENFCKNVRLILQHGKLVYPFSEMKVGQMEQLHFHFPPAIVRK